MQKRSLIIAPHADDEIIGCFEVLQAGGEVIVAFPTSVVLREASQSAEFFGFSRMLLHNLGNIDLKQYTIFIPDAYFELHPLHRELGGKVHEFRRLGLNVVCYSTNMNAPYIREVQDVVAKQRALTSCYPEKSSLWAYDHKYFLFEGHCKYIDTWQD
jgi:hypothetical protein